MYRFRRWTEIESQDQRERNNVTVLPSKISQKIKSQNNVIQTLSNEYKCLVLHSSGSGGHSFSSTDLDQSVNSTHNNP